MHRQKSLGVAVIQDLERKLGALQALFHLWLVLLINSLLDLRLSAGKLSKLFLEGGNLLPQLLGPGRCLVEFGRQFPKQSISLLLLGSGFTNLLVAPLLELSGLSSISSYGLDF